MANEDFRYSQDDAHVMNNDFSQPYARRSVGAVFFLSVLAVAVLLFAGWYFFDSGEDNAVENIAYTQQQMARQAPGNPHAPDTGRSAVYNFFYSMFEGIGNAVGGDTPDFDTEMSSTTPTSTFTGSMTDQEALVALEQFYRQFDGQDSDRYTQSVFDVLGSPVIDENSQELAHIHDIIISIDNGEAQSFILDKGDMGDETDLVKLDFVDMRLPVSETVTAFATDKETVETAPAFDYEQDFDGDNFISLLYLRNADILDFEGNVIGGVDAVLFENATAQNIYFSLMPPVNTDIATTGFMISYDALDVLQTRTGYALKLDKVQSLHLAERLFPNSAEQ